MNFNFHSEAENEFNQAIEHYEQCEGGLGFDFALEVYSTIERILAYPTTWPVLEDDVRRCLTHRFPFGVLYSVEPEGIFILSVMHLHRDPEYWKERK
jgi:hypothetical protein